MKRKRYLKLLLELMVIFVSVVLAFLFDDLRESRSEKAHYRADLLTLREGLAGQIENMIVKLDTFRFKEDLSYRGSKVKRLANMMLFDSLLGNRKASMAHFRLLLESNYLEPEFGSYGRLPLADEIRVKYTEQNGAVTGYLTIYEEEMESLAIVNEEIRNSYREMEKLIRKMNPFLKFSKQDSLLMYSNEFIWTYKHSLATYLGEFQFSKYLVQQRLLRILKGIHQELEDLGEKELKRPCVQPSFRERFQCEHNRKLDDSDSLSRTDHITITIKR